MAHYRGGTVVILNGKKPEEQRQELILLNSHIERQ